MSARRDPLNSGRTLAVGVGAVAIVGVVTLLAILFNGGGSGDGGAGTGGSGTNSTPGVDPNAGAVVPTTQAIYPEPMKGPPRAERPLRVVIRDNDYVVNGQTVNLEQFITLAGQVEPGPGAAVMVERAPSSRAKAENELKEALGKLSIPFTMD